MNVLPARSPTKPNRPLLGVRKRPGRLALAVFRLPLPLYRAGWGGCSVAPSFFWCTRDARQVNPTP